LGVPKVRALFETTLFAGLRKAGMPEEWPPPVFTDGAPGHFGGRARGRCHFPTGVCRAVTAGVAMRSTLHYLLVNLVNSSRLVDRAAAGEEIVIAKAGKPKAKLVPYQPPRKRRRFGQNLLGITYIADDFDGPLPPELQKYFE
jgi:antitoxin (DNA-binding transcriptional repressor) of toxin-antitoxin stability system